MKKHSYIQVLSKLFFAFIIVMSANRSFGQAVTNYTFTASGGTFTALSGATAPTMSAGSVDDGYFNALPIGFDFWYMGTRYTTISASTNGWLTLGANITDALIENEISASGAPRPVIAPLWDDLSFALASNITYNTTGSVGSRIFTIQYLNARWDYSNTANCISFQVKLYESTGKIDFIYRTSLEPGSLISPSASIGITAAAGGSGNFRSLNNSGASPTVSSTIATNSIATKPANNQTYSFTPAIPTAPASLSFTSVTASSMTLNWSDLSSNERGFVIYRSTDGGSTFTFASQVGANVTSSNQAGLTVGTTYHWRVYAVTEGGLSNALTGNQSTSCNAPVISQIPTGNLILHYKLDGNATDASGNNNGTLQNAPVASADRFNVNTRAYTLNGTNQHITTSNIYSNPTNFTISIWFKTNTTTGGKLMGFGNSQTGSSTSHDRALYMTNSGNLIFGVYYNFAQRTIISPATYNDNNWHLATVTFSSTAGMIMYVDGAQVAANASYTIAENITGYWRIGYDNIGGWPSVPSSYYFKGTIDEVLIYHRSLNSTEVNSLYTSADGASNNGPVCTNSQITLNATTLSGASYSWTGPNGFTSNVQNPTFTYTAAAAGTYSVQVSMPSCGAGVTTAYTNVISGPVGPTPSASTTQTCIGGSTGTITASATGGSLPYTYSLDAGAYQSSNVFSSLAAGTYTLNVRSNEGCISSIPVSITSFNAAPDNQNTAGTNSWIGHVYDGTAFNTYAGYYTKSETFNESHGGSAVCLALTSSAGARSIFTETFSVKYRMNSTKNGLYVVDLGSDDGSRLTVDNVLVHNNWSDHGYVLVPRVLMNLSGTSSLLYEFYENGGANQVNFENLTLVLANTLSVNISQAICIGGTGSVISGDAFGVLPSGVSLSGTGYQWSYSTTPAGSKTDIAGATGATFTPSGLVAPFNVAGTYYLYRKASVTSTNNISPNPYTATNESNAAVITITAPPSATISYSGSPFCITSGTATVTRTGTAGGTYSSTAGLSINAATGEITPSTSTPGNYTVTYTIAASGGCAQVITTTNVQITATISNNHLDFSNGGNGVVCATPAENGTASLTAPAGNVFIYVGFASYGTPTGTCSNFAIGTCHASTSQAVGESYLHGNSSVSIPATNAVFTDPCVGTTKRLYVQATYTKPVCSNTLPGTITGTTPVGGGTSYSYLWEQSTTGPATGFSPAAGTNNQQNYTPGILTQSTWYRRTVTGNVCGANISPAILIPVVTAPSATISYPGTPFCSSAGTASVTLTGTPGGTFSSTAGLSINATTGAINLGSSTAGSYVVTYTIPATASCVQFTATANVTITLQPNATGTYVGNPYCSNGGTIFPTGSAVGAMGSFSSTSGLSINPTTGAINLGASTPGTYDVIYTVPASGGCAVYSKSTPVIINAAPSATISYSNGPFCTSGTTKSVTRTGTAGGTYSSTAGLVINSSTGEINLASSNAGSYTITYSIAASGGCAAFSTTTNVTITQGANATFTYPSSPYLTNGGTATPNFSGTTGGTFTSTSGLDINVSTGAVNLATTTPGTFTVTYTIAANGGCSTFTTTANITVDQYVIPVKTWDGGAGTSNWGDANNWNPNGVPTASDDVDLNGAFTININVNATTKNLLLDHPGLVLTQLTTSGLSVNGNLTMANGTYNMAGGLPSLTGTIAVNGGTIGFIGTGTQTIPAFNYHNLVSSSTGARILQNSGTIGIAGSFDPGPNTYTIAGSTISYNGSTDQAIAEFAYNNLALTTSGVKTFASGTSSIAGLFTIGGTASANATANSPFIRYNGTGNQTLTPISYYGVDISSGATVTLNAPLSLARFRMNSGFFNLNSNTLDISDSAAFNAGTINNGGILSFASTALFAGTTFGATVGAAASNLLLNGSTFNNTVILTKNGAATVVSEGGNTFNGTTTITNAGTGNYTLGNVNADVFNNDLTLGNTGASGHLYVAHQATGNQFNGNIALNNSASGIHFGVGNGTSVLAANKTIAISGSGFSAGTLTLARFTQLGTTAQTLALTGTSTLYAGPSTTFNGNVTFTSPRILLENTTFNGSADITKNGSGDNISTGGNTFNGVTILTNSGSGSFELGNLLPETFNNNTTINSTGANRIQIGLSSVGNIFNGDVTINHIGSVTGNNTLIARNTGSTATINGNLVLNCNHANASSGIIIANDGQVTINGNITVSSTNGRGILFGAASGSVTLGNGFSITDGGVGTYTTGTLTLNRFTQLGSTAQSLNLTGTASLLLGPSSVFNGAVNFSAAQVLMNGTTFNSSASIEKTGATDNTSSGGNIFNGLTSITNSGTGFFRLGNSTGDDFNGDVNFRQTGSGLLQPAYRNNNTFSANLSVTGTSTAINFGTGTGTVTMNGNTPQAIEGSLVPTFYNLAIDNTGSSVTPAVNCNITNLLSVNSGTFHLNGFTANRATIGGTLSVANGARLTLGGSNLIPSNFTTHSIGATSTIEYSGTSQTVQLLNTSQDYGHLVISGTNAQTLTAINVRSDISVSGSFSINANTIRIGRNIMTTGTFNAVNGTVELNGTIAQTVPAGAFNTNTVRGLTINNNSGVSILGTLNLIDVLTVSNGSVASNGHLTLKSTETATARIAPITSSSPTPITGNVNVERFVKGRRKYRLMASSVTTSQNVTLSPGQENLSIWHHWQNQGIATSNKGTFITGGISADGFDTQTPNASLFTYDDVNRRYVGFTSANGKKTKYTPLQAGISYYMFVYGDRLNTITTSTPNNTVLTSTGTVLTGDQLYTTNSTIPLSGVNGRFTLLGNPFASPIDWATIQRSNVANSFWGWDPNLSSTGGYVTVSSLGNTTLMAPYSGVTGLNQYIQSGQGFFVKTTGASPTMTIREQDKASENNSIAFRGQRGTNELPLIAVNIFYPSGPSKVLADGVLTAFDASFTSAIGSEDASKMANTAETISILTKGEQLSIDGRPMPSNNDTIALNIARFTKPQYTMQIFMKEIPASNIHPYLVDSYLGTMQPLMVLDTNNIVINMNATIPASIDVNRFKIVFKTTVALPVKFTSVSASRKNDDIEVKWSIADESDIVKYEIERSADAVNFVKVSEVASTGNNIIQSYDWLDINPLSGNNYYRIRAIEVPGTYILSKMVMVKMDEQKEQFKVFPNPVSNGEVNLSITSPARSRHDIMVYDASGKLVIKKQVNHNGGTSTHQVHIGKMLTSGIYEMRIITDGTIKNIKLFVQ